MITSTMSVREILARYPGSRAVFDRYGLLECGGGHGPQEPIGFFASVHKVDPQKLLAELNDAAATGEAAGEQAAGTPVVASAGEARPGVELYKKFIKAALLLIVTGGATLGALNLTMIARARNFELQDYWPWWTALVQAHGHVQLYGWCGLFIMGVSYVVLPRFMAVELKSRHLAEASFWLMIAGILLRAYFQPFASQPYAAHWLVWSATSELVSVTLFLYAIGQITRRSPARHEVFAKYLYVGCLWFWITTAALLALSVWMVATGEDHIPKYYDDPYLHATLLGFIGMFMFGISLRTLPFFLGVREPDDRTSQGALAVLNIGILLVLLGRLAPRAGGLLAARASLLLAVGANTELIAIIAIVQNLHLFERPVNPVILEEVTRDYEKFVKVAYAWVLLSGAMLTGYALYQLFTDSPVTHPWMGAYRHAITVGFVSMMIFGMAGRIVPVFEGQQLYSASLFNASFWLLNVGNLMRVSFQILAGKYGGVFYLFMGVSSYLEVTACAIFSYVLWKTMDAGTVTEERSGVEPPGTLPSGESLLPLGASTKVAQVLDSRPETLQVFLKHGFTQLQVPAMRNTIAKVTTLGIACQMKGKDLNELIQDLTETIQGSSPATPRNNAIPSPSPATADRDLIAEKLVWEALTRCYDPEIPEVNIVDLGLVYRVTVSTEGEAAVTMTLTTEGCPLGDMITSDVTRAVSATPGVRSAKVDLVFDPRWSPERVSPETKAKLGF